MNRVLIIKLGALGDVVMATPLFRLIQSHHAGERCVLLTSPDFAPLFSGWPDLETAAFPRRGLRAMAAALAWIRRGQFARIYDLQSNDRSAILCAFSGCPARIGNHPRLPYSQHPASAWRGQSHIFERMIEVLRAAGVTGAPGAPSLPTTGADRETVRGWLEEHDLRPGSAIVVHAGASAAHPEKRWPGFASLVTALRARGVPVIASGGAGDAGINRELAATGAIDATGRFTLPQLAELARHARAAITNDSGPMHVLSCAGIPVYGLFGPTDWRRNHAVGQADRVIAAGPAPTPLALLAPATVLGRLESDGLIDQPRPAARS